MTFSEIRHLLSHAPRGTMTSQMAGRGCDLRVSGWAYQDLHLGPLSCQTNQALDLPVMTTVVTWSDCPPKSIAVRAMPPRFSRSWSLRIGGSWADSLDALALPRVTPRWTLAQPCPGWHQVMPLTGGPRQVWLMELSTTATLSAVAPA
jgi:hypothetical protein